LPFSGIDLEMFGVLDDTGPDVGAATRRQARILAGCLWGASIAIIDQLFEDLSELIELGDGADADADEGPSSPRCVAATIRASL